MGPHPTFALVVLFVGRTAPEPAPEVVAVGDQAVHRAEDEEREEDVEQRQPREHEVQAVEHQQHPADAAEHGGAGHPPEQPAHHQHHQRADDGRGDPPAERVHPERLLAEGDQPLADLGVHGHRGIARPHVVDVAGEDVVVDLVLGVAVDVGQVGLRVAVVEQRPGVLGVVRLVEREPLRRTEVIHPQREGQQRHADRRQPADHPLARTEPRQVATRPLHRRRHLLPVRGPRQSAPPRGGRLLVGRGHEPELYGPSVRRWLRCERSEPRNQGAACPRRGWFRGSSLAPPRPQPRRLRTSPPVVEDRSPPLELRTSRRPQAALLDQRGRAPRVSSLPQAASSHLNHRS